MKQRGKKKRKKRNTLRRFRRVREEEKDKVHLRVMQVTFGMLCHWVLPCGLLKKKNYGDVTLAYGKVDLSAVLQITAKKRKRKKKTSHSTKYQTKPVS